MTNQPPITESFHWGPCKVKEDENKGEKQVGMAQWHSPDSASLQRHSHQARQASRATFLYMVTGWICSWPHHAWALLCSSLTRALRGRSRVTCPWAATVCPCLPQKAGISFPPKSEDLQSNKELGVTALGDTLKLLKCLSA